jgi:hypothetical protein
VDHGERVKKIAEAFKAASAELATKLENLPQDAAGRRPQDGGWSAAQIGWHVALSNDVFSNVISGAMPMAVPPAADFAEDWTRIAIPAKIQTFPILVPPDETPRDEMLAKLRGSADRLLQAIESMPPDRATMCVQLQFGTMSLYQFGEFAGAHVRRHIGQLERTLTA